MTSDGIELKYYEINDEEKKEDNNENIDDTDNKVLEVYSKSKSKKRTQEILRALYNIEITEYRINKILKSHKK
jgi:hypothetical protein